MKKLLFLALILLASIDENAAQDRKTILAVFAHADDEITVSPLLSKLAREGNRVYLAIATDGRNGVTSFAGIPAGDSLAKKRKEEALCAASKLKIEPPVFIGLADGSLSRADVHPVLKKKLQEVFLSIKPDVILTWGPEGGYGHPDHRMVSNMVTEIFQEGCENCPARLFYAGFPAKAKKELPLKTMEAMWLMQSFHFVKQQYLTYRIPFTEADLEAAKASYQCHQSQYRPDTIAEIFRITGLAGNITYLRPFAVSQGISDHLFK